MGVGGIHSDRGNREKKDTRAIFCNLVVEKETKKGASTTQWPRCGSSFPVFVWERERENGTLRTVSELLASLKGYVVVAHSSPANRTGRRT